MKFRRNSRGQTALRPMGQSELSPLRSDGFQDSQTGETELCEQ
jgi:hypothetical protein